jgi:hypothetical protein
MDHFLWCLVSSPGAYSMPHADPEGFITVVINNNGWKGWKLIRTGEKDVNMTSPGHMAYFDPTPTGNDPWGGGVTLSLKERSILYMRGNSVHSVLTLKSSITTGVFVYMYGGMERAAYALNQQHFLAYLRGIVPADTG